MATNFLWAAGTGGLIASQLSLLTTELNGLNSGIAVTSSVGGASGAFTQTNFGSGIWGVVQFKSGGSFTPAAGQCLYGWWLLSIDGTNYETQTATGSTTVSALQRAADFVIPFSNAAYASGNIALANGLIRIPFVKCKAVIQSSGGTQLPSTGNIISIGPGAVQY